MDINLSKLTLEQLIELYKDYVNATDGAAYFVQLLHDKGWITSDKEGETR